MPLHIYCKVTDDIWMTTVLMLPAPSCDPLPSHTPHPRLAKRSGLPSADGLRWTSSTGSNAQNAKAARTRPRVRLRRLLLPRRQAPPGPIASRSSRPALPRSRWPDAYPRSPSHLLRPSVDVAVPPCPPRCPMRERTAIFASASAICSRSCQGHHASRGRHTLPSLAHVAGGHPAD